MTPSYSFELVQRRVDHQAYLRLRRAVFCDEQRLFEGTDEDEHDAVAHPIIAVHRGGHEGPEVVGVVRIYEAEPGVWYGGRLGVAPAHRKQGLVGTGLIRKAVTTAHAWGCRRFLALVQEANVRLFTSLAWRAIEERLHRGQPHCLMEADLASYPPEAPGEPPMASGWR